MTRRGTLAYYLAAWVIGCFVVAFLRGEEQDRREDDQEDRHPHEIGRAHV
jgi:hypothetical protein